MFWYLIGTVTIESALNVLLIKNLLPLMLFSVVTFGFVDEIAFWLKMKSGDNSKESAMEQLLPTQSSS